MWADCPGAVLGRPQLRMSVCVVLAGDKAGGSCRTKTPLSSTEPGLKSQPLCGGRGRKGA